MRISRVLSSFLLVGCIVSVAAPLSLGQGERPQRGQGGPGGGRGGFGGGFGGGGGMASLLGIKEVRDELKIDEEQTKEYEDFVKENGGGRGGPGGGGPGGAGGRGGPGGGGPGGGGPGGGAPGGRGGFNLSETDLAKMRADAAARLEKAEAMLEKVLDPVQLDRLVGLYVQRDGFQTLSSKKISTLLEITEDQKAKIAEKEKEFNEERMSLFSGGFDREKADEMRTKMEKIRKENDEKIANVLNAAQKTKMEELKGAKFEFPARVGFGGRGGNPQ